MNLADNLKKIRKDNNLTQEQLAEKLGVSRQAVSKWESGISYPEMDKTIQICQMFNLNINDFINEDIKEVNEVKEAERRTNKYISSFFEYITKLVDMFSSMSFKEKAKCLFEQCIVGTIIFVILLIIGGIAENLITSLLIILPEKITFFLLDLLEVLYVIIALIIGAAVFLHIFKIRYLDYYEIIKEDDSFEKIEEINEDNKTNNEQISAIKVENENGKIKKNKIYLEKKKEKIIIRDPKHSEYKFLTGLGKIILWFIKMIASFILLGFAVTFVILVIFVPLSFLIVKSGFLFNGLLISILGTILLNFIIIELLYNFIINKKFNKTKIFIMGIISLIMVGLGIGFIGISATEFAIEEKQLKTTNSSFSFDMEDDLLLDFWNFYGNEIEFIEKDINNIEIIVEHAETNNVDIYNNENKLMFHLYSNETKIADFIKEIINDINHKKLISYTNNVKIYVYANKSNIAILKENRHNYNEEIASLNNQINEYEDTINKQNQNYQSLSEEKERLEEIIENSGLKIDYDANGNIISITSLDEEIDEE